MDPLYVELTEYLRKDNAFDWVFTNPLVKKQLRSKSEDMRLPWNDEREDVDAL